MPFSSLPASAAARPQNERYHYRGLPCSIAPDQELWCVSGVDAHGGAGILEWCYNEDDALTMLEEMKRYPQFSKLEANPYCEK